MRIVDLQIQIDGLRLEGGATVEDFIKGLEVDSAYPVTYEILYEEEVQ